MSEAAPAHPSVYPVVAPVCVAGLATVIAAAVSFASAPHGATWAGFDYRYPDGTLVRDIETLRRLRSLAVPPAWSAVWINPDPLGHIQATGAIVR